MVNIQSQEVQEKAMDCLILKGKTLRSFEKSVNVYHSERRDIP